MGVTNAYQLPVPSTELEGPVELHDFGRQVVIVFNYRREVRRFRGEIRFKRVRAYRHRAEIHCTAGQIEGAYDTLVEVEDSPWAREVRSETNPHFQEQWSLRHWMIYFDSNGCYELLAESWSAEEHEL